MDKIVLLIISLLSSALVGNVMSSGTSSNSSRVSLLQQLLPTFSLKSQNGSIHLHQIPSHLIYGNSSVRAMLPSELPEKIFNLTASQYSPSEMSVLMAFPTIDNSLSSLKSNESISAPNNYNNSKANISSGQFKVNDRLNFSSRALDFQELFSLLSSLNVLGHKIPVMSTTPSYATYPEYAKTVKPVDEPYPEYAQTAKPVYGEPYPQIAAVAYVENAPNYESVPNALQVKPNPELPYR